MFIYENICQEFGVEKLAKEFDESYKVKNFDSNIPERGFFLGSIAGCKWMKENRPNVKFFSTFENFTCAAYYPKMGELLFNDKYAFIPFKDLPRRKWDIYSWLGTEASVFIRPDSGEKDTPAQIVYLEDIDSFVDSYDYDGLAVVSTPKQMIGEWRFVVANKKIVCCSLYKFQGAVVSAPTAPQGAYDLVEKAVQRYQPDEIFCVDVVMGVDEKFYVMELTSFSSAGLYANPVEKIAPLIKQYI